jgi:hypothetical protein
MLSRSTDIRSALRSRQRGFLLNPYRFGSPPPTSPTLPNLVGWYKLGTDITEVAGVVSQWGDQSGLAHHLVQATAGSRPTKQVDGSVLFDFHTLQALFTFAQPATVYVRVMEMGRGISSITGNVIYDGGITSKMQCSQGGPAAYKLDIWNNVVGSIGGSQAQGTLIGDFGTFRETITAVYDSASSGYQVDSGTFFTGDMGTPVQVPAFGGFTLGGRANDTNHSSIKVYEALLYSVAHSLPDRATNIAYLSNVN